MTTDPSDRWNLRTVPAELRERYLAEGWWTDESLGQMVADGLAPLRDTAFRIHSEHRPWTGTFGDVDGAARRLAGELRARGVGPGDVIMFQLPNWVEAGITFWAAAYLGAVVVPVVHFYGRKEVDYILGATDPAVVISAERFGAIDYRDTYTAAMADRTDAIWLVVGDTPASGLPDGAERFDAALDGDPVDGPADVDPDAPVIIAFTSGTTRDPKGVIHSHRTIGFESRQLNGMHPGYGPPGITGAPVGHFIGMLSAFLMPLLRDAPVNLVDVWNPEEVLRLMREEGLGMGGGATYFVTSLLDHPDFSPEHHLPNMPFAGLGGSNIPLPVSRRLASLGIKPYRSYGSTEHPSITGCHITDPEEKRLATDGRPLQGVEMFLDDEGQIHSRGPDCFMGYIDPELTASVFDEAGWYRTGDVGVLDEDGFLSITDRIADVIIRGGENISAVEVEEQLLGIDGVAEAVVVAVPDDRFGERAAAVLRMVDDRDAPTLDDIRSHLAEVDLAKQKWPESVHRVEEFPRTPSGKIKKFEVRRDLRGH